jgi:hypothetical protein
MAEPTAAQGIEQAVTQALAHRGVGGTVVVRENTCELRVGGGPATAIDLGDWVAQWNLLPEDVRLKRAETAATRLLNALGEAGGGAATGKAQGGIPPLAKKLVVYGLVLAAASAIGVWLYRRGFFGARAADPVASAAATVEEETPEGARARVERACEAGRQRILAGGALDLDVEGWVVELWLARAAAGLDADPAVKRFVERGAASEIGATSPAAVALVADPAGAGLPGALLQLSGGYVAAFFAARGRERFIAVAEQLADDSAAGYAALFARCAHLPGTRDVGAWYRGVDPAGPWAALLFAAGAFAEPPAFDRAKLADLGGLSGLAERVGAHDKKARDELLRVQGGRLTPRAGDAGAGSSSIVFAFGGPTRPAAASRELAKQLGL